MSGGVDSSVALLRVVNEGYEAVGVTMKLWETTPVSGTLSRHTYCCSVDAINNAKLVCQKLGVPHYTLDFQDLFRLRVVDYLVDEYLSGRTPNPCIQCNIHLRWGGLIHKADTLNARWIATGHYAVVDRSRPGRPVIRRGRDRDKDQTYVLWGIPPETVDRTLFPVGELTKTEVRRIAAEAGLVTASVPESQDICFIPNNDYRRFLHDYAPDRMKKDPAGDFVSPQGEPVGRHEGLSRYTVGQRRKLGVTGPRPLYVQKINPEERTITLATRDQMLFDGCTVEKINWLHLPEGDGDGRSLTVHIRYHHPGVPCRITRDGDSGATVAFHSPQFAVTPGQSAVFYDGDELLGGGIIREGRLHD